ncbi:uncharacterized protein F5891DRAFT_1196060 [Suillus fuscotomentosus]|uniref:Uncharacterized protein n=1 Tax=Suillus fuscotomentosus TaxID=1912939 RepID=A0AAD4DTU3_9AGAM|nr:uncharacterized protein F5891DRAFT_1196060 [Suillus fuscotomentosus]KAG1893717.1 hypothetical protein F5891DRAFT_1196060 [Suillus fuscotomentosus]
MSSLSSPSSAYSTLEPLEFKADPEVVSMLVQILTTRHGILHYHGETGELATYQWPTDRHGRKIHPSQFKAYRETHYLSELGGYVEESMLPNVRPALAPICLKTNQAVGDPLLHDDQVCAVAMSPDGKYIASAGLDKTIYVWSLEAALKNVLGADDRNSKLQASHLCFSFTLHLTFSLGTSSPTESCAPTDCEQPHLFSCLVRPLTPVLRLISRFKIPDWQDMSVQYTKIQGNGFFGDESDHTSRRAAPSTSLSSLVHWCHLLSSIHFGTRPLNGSQPIRRRSRHWNFNFQLFSGGHSTHTVDAPLAQDEDRYGIVHETDVEAAAAMQRTNSSWANSLTQSGQPAAAQPSQAQPIQTQAQGSTGGAEDFVYTGVTCCAWFFGLRRPASHQSCGTRALSSTLLSCTCV